MEKREYIGSSKRITINDNKIHLRIIGNDNKINMKSNSGHLDVIGNSSRVKIGENSGRVNYIGNSGKVYLGSTSAATDVHYSGNNGTMKIVDKDELWKNHSHKQNKWPTNQHKWTSKKCWQTILHHYENLQKKSVSFIGIAYFEHCKYDRAPFRPKSTSKIETTND